MINALSHETKIQIKCKDVISRKTVIAKTSHQIPISLSKCLCNPFDTPGFQNMVFKQGCGPHSMFISQAELRMNIQYLNAKIKKEKK